MPTALGRYVLFRARFVTEAEELYVAVDPEAGLVDVHLFPAGEGAQLLLQAALQLQHPHVAVALDAGGAERDLYLVEEHVEGVPLDALLRHGPLPGEVFLHVAATLAAALAEAERVAEAFPGLSLCVPRAGDVFVSWAGHVKMSACALLLPSGLVGPEPLAALGGPRPRPASGRAPQALGSGAAMAGLMSELLGPPTVNDDTATKAGRQLMQMMSKSRVLPGDYRELHELAVAALRRVAQSPTGEFVAAKLADLVELRAAAAAVAESELIRAGAAALTLPVGAPRVPGVRSFLATREAEPYDAYHVSAEAEPPPRPSIPPAGVHALGERLPGTPYRLIRRLGLGGMGIVFLAEHVELNRSVAIKVLSGPLRRDPQMLARFRQEARSAARIHHPNVVSVYDFGATAAGELYLVMELLDGVTLTALREAGELTVDRTVALLTQVCEGVEAAHQAGVIHRDLKPDNVMITKVPRSGGGPPEDLVKVLDFGIARVRSRDGRNSLGPDTMGRGELIGTPEFMAPEQILGMKGDQRSDVYALGCIAYEALTGAPPFCGETPASTLAAHLRQPPAPLRERAPHADVPESLERVVLRALAKEPDDRYQSMAELAAALNEALAFPMELTPLTPVESEPILLRPPTSPRLTPPPSATSPQAAPPPAPARSAWSRPALWGGLGLLLGVGAQLWWMSRPHPAPGATAPRSAPALAEPGAATVRPAPEGRQGTVGAPPSLPEAGAEAPGPGAAERSGPATAEAQRPVAASPEAPRPAAAEGPRPAPAAPGDETAQAPLRRLRGKGKAQERAEGGPETIAADGRRPLLAAAAPARPAAPQAPAEAPPAGAAPRAAPAGAAPRSAPAAPVPRPAPAEPRAEAPSVASAPPAASAPAASAPVASAPVASAPPVPGAPAVAAGKPAPAPPRYRDGRLAYTIRSATGAYGRRDLGQGLDSARRLLDGCYRDAVRRSPAAPPSGSAAVSFALNEDGYLSPGSLRAEGAAAALRPCLDRALQAARFPRPEMPPVLVSLELSLEPIQ